MEHQDAILWLNIINVVGLILIGIMKAIKKSSCRNKFCSCVYSGSDDIDIEEALSHTIEKIKKGETDQIDIKKLEFARGITRKRVYTI